MVNSLNFFHMSLSNFQFNSKASFILSTLTWSANTENIYQLHHLIGVSVSVIAYVWYFLIGILSMTCLHLPTVGFFFFSLTVWTFVQPFIARLYIYLSKVNYSFSILPLWSFIKFGLRFCYLTLVFCFFVF